VPLVGDEVILFDATQGEERARKDAEAIARLFPGTHKMTLVVTDLAWPHIAGVRYWVASGATIVAHKAAREFLQRVIDRRWTVSPDLLERRRKAARLKLVGVDGTYRLAGGTITLHPIDGIGSEGALMAYVAADRFLWASDYIQTVAEPTAYAAEVLAAVRRDGLTPERTAAQHLPLTPWTQIEELLLR
jgi:flavorubredoxin